MRALVLALLVASSAVAQPVLEHPTPEIEASVTRVLDAWRAGTIRDDGVIWLLGVALRWPETIERLGADADALRGALLRHPFPDPDIEGTGAPERTDGERRYLRAGQVAHEVGRPETLIGRFSYWCLADRYRSPSPPTTAALGTSLGRWRRCTKPSPRPPTSLCQRDLWRARSSSPAWGRTARAPRTSADGRVGFL